MIAYLQGNVVYKQANSLIINVSGVGYEVSVPIALMAQAVVGQVFELFIHHNVREDGHFLFGFQSFEQRQLFRELIRVSGIGPKLALLILSGFSVEALVEIIREQNSAALISLPGIGKKTAERLLIELNDRVGKAFITPSVQTSASIASPNLAVKDSEEALIALGYKPAEAARLLEKVLEDYEDGALVAADTLLKKALQYKFKSGR